MSWKRTVMKMTWIPKQKWNFDIIEYYFQEIIRHPENLNKLPYPPVFGCFSKLNLIPQDSADFF